MKKTVFIADRWVKFVFEGQVCLGRTYRAKITNLEESLNRLVFLITKERKTKTINISQCINLKYLEFIAKSPKTKELKVNTEELVLEILVDLLVSSGTSENMIRTLAKKQVRTSSKN